MNLRATFFAPFIFYYKFPVSIFVRLHLYIPLPPVYISSKLSGVLSSFFLLLISLVTFLPSDLYFSHEIIRDHVFQKFGTDLFNSRTG